MIRRFIGLGLTACMLTGPAQAGGLDRTGQSLSVLFEEGGTAGAQVRLDYSRTAPHVTGQGDGITGYVPAGTQYDNVADAFSSLGAALKFRLSDRLTAAVIAERPFGSDVLYPGSAQGSEFGGTTAWAETASLTAVLRYQFDQHWSVHGGLRMQEIEGKIRLSGWAYGPPAVYGIPTANGYKVDLGRDTALGYVIGASYEIPEIALRATLTYNSTITHEMDTVEQGNRSATLDGSSVTEVKTPQSVNLYVQTGIAIDTLVYGSVRWAKWSEFRIDPKGFSKPVSEGGSGVGLVDLDDTFTYTLGIGHQFNDAWSGAAEVFYEPRKDDIVAPLFPSVGFWGVGVSGSYETGDWTLSAGVRYTSLGDGSIETFPVGVERAHFEENEALSVGMRVAYNF